MHVMEAARQCDRHRATHGIGDGFDGLRTVHDRREPVLERYRPRGDQRAVFAQTVPHEHRDGYSCGFENGEHRQRGRYDGGLHDRRHGQTVAPAGTNRRGKAFAVPFLVQVVGPGDDLPGFGEAGQAAVEHADALAAVTGEACRDVTDGVACVLRYRAGRQETVRHIRVLDPWDPSVVFHDGCSFLLGEIA